MTDIDVYIVKGLPGEGLPPGNPGDLIINSGGGLSYIAVPLAGVLPKATTPGETLIWSNEGIWIAGFVKGTVEDGNSDGQILQWNETTKKWLPSDFPTIPLSLLQQDGANAGQVLAWNGAEWSPTDVQDPLLPGTFTGEILIWNEVTEMWEPSPFPTIPLSLIQQDGAIVGQVITWDGSAWIAGSVSGTIPDGMNPGDYLIWDGVAWLPEPPPPIPLSRLEDGGAALDNVLVWDGVSWTPSEVIDVFPPGSSDNEIFIWDNIGLSWTISSTLPLSVLAETGATNGQVIGWDGSSWNPTTITGTVPDGTNPGDFLQWNGAVWGVIQFIPLSGLAQTGATNGQAIIWNGASWAPATITGTLPDGSADDQILLWNNSLLVWEPSDFLPLTSLEQDGATNGQVLTWTGISWNPSSISGTVPDGTANGQVLEWDEDNTQWNVVDTLPLTVLDQDGASNGQAIIWNGAAWAPATIAGTVPDGNTNNQILLWIGGNWTISDFLPFVSLEDGIFSGDVLMWDGSVWAPTQILELPVGINDGDFLQWVNATTEWVPIQYIPLTGLEQDGASNGQAIIWNGAAWEPATISGTVPDGTANGQVLEWDEDNTQWNVVDTLPLTVLDQDGASNDQAIIWNGAAWAPGDISGTVPDGTTNSQLLRWNSGTSEWTATASPTGAYSFLVASESFIWTSLTRSNLPAIGINATSAAKALLIAIGLDAYETGGNINFTRTLNTETNPMGFYINFSGSNTYNSIFRGIGLRIDTRQNGGHLGDMYGVQNNVDTTGGLLQDVYGSYNVIAGGSVGGTTYGNYSSISGTFTGPSYAVYAENTGSSTADRHGVYASANNVTSTGTAYGVFATGNADNSSGTAYGIWATATSGSTQWAGYFDEGNVHVENNLDVVGTINYPNGGSDGDLATRNSAGDIVWQSLSDLDILTYNGTNGTLPIWTGSGLSNSALSQFTGIYGPVVSSNQRIYAGSGLIINNFVKMPNYGADQYITYNGGTDAPVNISTANPNFNVTLLLYQDETFIRFFGNGLGIGNYEAIAAPVRYSLDPQSTTMWYGILSISINIEINFDAPMPGIFIGYTDYVDAIPAGWDILPTCFNIGDTLMLYDPTSIDTVGFTVKVRISGRTISFIFASTSETTGPFTTGPADYTVCVPVSSTSVP